jgi:hypothetical protein
MRQGLGPFPTRGRPPVVVRLTPKALGRDRMWSGRGASPVPGPLRVRIRRPVGLLLGAWLFALVLETAPHLVHHLFDEDPASACEFLAAADHDLGIVGASLAFTSLPARDGVPDHFRPHASTVAVPAAVSRAPPLAFLARL